VLDQPRGKIGLGIGTIPDTERTDTERADRFFDPGS
jgi:hypothetical protein